VVVEPDSLAPQDLAEYLMRSEDRYSAVSAVGHPQCPLEDFL